MKLLIVISKETTTIPEAQQIYAFLKEAAEPFPGMRIHATITQNEDPYVVPNPEPPA